PKRPSDPTPSQEVPVIRPGQYIRMIKSTPSPLVPRAARLRRTPPKVPRGCANPHAESDGGHLLFALADYRRLWAIGALTGMARWLEFVAVAIFAYELTRSPQLVALLAVLRMVPYVSFGFLMGAVADAKDRQRLLVVAFTMMVAASAAMLVV